MFEIRVLDNETIDKIAAGEVVERPVSIVKELVENSIDAGATIITIEIKEGGLKLIRVTDNGSGIDPSQIRNAFLPHATSKISSSEDLDKLYTLGFRGEALSSIAAVSRIELTTRVEGSLEGVHYQIEGGKEITCESAGAPVGTTFIVRDIFYNTLPRLKFLKSATTEGNLIADLCEHIALSMPHISFQFINNGATRFSTSGQGDLKEVIYRIYGRETAMNLRAIDKKDDDLKMSVTGYLGLPAINRANRASELFFINHRYIKSPLLSRAVEEGYIEYLMQHKFPFCILDLSFDPSVVDVNVHPTKQEVRISNEKDVYDHIVEWISSTLSEKEMLDDVTPVSDDKGSDKSKPSTEKIRLPEMFEQTRINNASERDADISDADHAVVSETRKDSDIRFTIDFDKDPSDSGSGSPEPGAADGVHVSSVMISPDVTSQMSMTAEEEFRELAKGEFSQTSFADDERVLSPDARRNYRIIGQVFKTYWLIEYNDTLMLMDQHAAHEKVNFERFMAHMTNKTEVPSQLVSPPDIFTASNREMQIIEENLGYFSELGFDLDKFGEHEIAIRSIPLDLFGNDPASLIGEIVSDLIDLKRGSTPDSIRTRIATMACKASVKGNNTMSVEEVETLLDEMLTLDNPYNCPHGRPTLITMSKTELDKRFHRIV
ncbi:MAG: DNA mismatch repair endonuclease MutL [Lachnospiraceae bacterium]|nr:DNA mismatch repair endonuclease MutL [Lachnospiraceae bacterium]